MTTDDLNQISKLLDQKLDKKIEASEKKISKLLDEKMGVSEEKISRSVDEKIKTSIKASEERLVERLTSEIHASEKRIIRDIGDFLEQSLLPQIDEKANKTDVERVERRVDALATQVGTIAHQLKLKK